MHTLIKQSLYLKAQYQHIKADIAKENAADGSLLKKGFYQGSIGTDAYGELGSWRDEYVLFATKESIYCEKLVAFESLVPIEIGLCYRSKNSVKGSFSKGWRASFEKRFVAVQENLYQLILEDGRYFLFEHEADGSFRDIGCLGVKVESVDKKHFILHYRDGKKESYAYGYLVGVEDRHKNRLYFTYEAGPRLVSIHNDLGLKVTFEYASHGCIERMRDQSGRVWEFDYKEEMLSRVKLNGTPWRYYRYGQYGAYALLQEVQSGSLSVCHLTYDASMNLSMVKAEGKEIIYSYGEESVIKQISDHTTRYRLNRFGVVGNIIYPDDTFASLTYDEKEHTVRYRTRGGNDRIEKYDAEDRLLWLSINDEIRQRYTYKGKHPLPVRYESDGRVVAFVYDAYGNLVEQINPDGTKRDYEYNAQGALISYEDEAKERVSYRYDANARVIEIIDALGAATHYEYDSANRVVMRKEPEGETFQYTYNAMDQVVSMRDGEGKEIAFAYGVEGLLETITDEAGSVTRFGYDAEGRVIEKTYPDTRKERYGYNKEGRVTQITRADGTSLHLAYDLNGNITKLQAVDEAGNQEQLAYEYDALSNLLLAKTPTHRVALRYNERANPTVEIQEGIRVDKGYDRHGALKRQVRFLQEQFLYAYDANGYLKQLSRDKADIVLQSDARGYRTQRAYPNQTKEHISYTPKGTIEKINEWVYDYDASGRVIKRSQSNTNEERAYFYSKGGMLERTECAEETELYLYSKAGNMLFKGSVEKSLDLSTPMWRYDAMNRLIEDDHWHYGYDKRGNLSFKVHKESKEKHLYLFNLFNQLIKRKHVDKTGALIAGYSYSYDALGRRVRKGCYTPQTYPTGITRYYLYDEENIIAILDEHKTLLASITHDSQTDTPLSITTYDNDPKTQPLLHQDLTQEERLFLQQQATQRSYYYHRDHQGSITHLTDEAGEVVEHFTYDAYGTILSHTRTQTTLNPYAYTGREFDAGDVSQTVVKTDDLYYYRARYYDPSTGRFISSDPIEFLSGDTNWYRYVGNDPVNHIDPTGFKGSKNKGPCAKDNRRRRKNKIRNAKKAIKNAKYARNVARATKAGIVADIVAPEPSDIVLWKWVGEAVAFVATEGAAMYLESQLMDLADLEALEMMEKECDKKAEAGKKSAKKGFNVKGAIKRLCGDRTKHKNQRPDSTARNPRKHEPKDKRSDSEHIPSQEFVKEASRQRFAGQKISDKAMQCIENHISGNLDTMIAPHPNHQSKSSQVISDIKNNKAVIAKDLHAQARHEADIWEKEAQKLEKTGKKGRRCAKLIRENLKYFRNLPKDYFTKIMDAAYAKCAHK